MSVGARTFEEYKSFIAQLNEEISQVKVLPMGDTSEDENGNITKTFYVIGGTPIARGYVVRNEFPLTYCQHSYDCCARLYRDTLPVVKVWNGGLHVTDKMYRNI